MISLPHFLSPGFLLSLHLSALAAPQSEPNWFADAVWYQVFPERFRNGDPTNDPVRRSLEGTWPYKIPARWQPSPWTSDWYKLQSWEQDGRGFHVHAQLRRYGGDLQGVIDKLDYLKDLGVNTLYLNPIFESASLHKYGATLYHHVDKHFGPDPAGDLALFAKEDPGDPNSWQWSAADKLFLKLVAEVHKREMRIIIDGVFNHVGIPFWAFQQAKREGPKSKYAGWFHISQWDDPTTPQDEFRYRGWAGVSDLPEFRKDWNGPHPEAKKHMHAVVKRWMDPNGDGNPDDGIDGWRLDVAAEVPLEFWGELRGWVKEINPQAYLTGEIWWEDYRNHKLKNAAPWLKETFDGVMNYRFADAVFRFANEEATAIDATRFLELLWGVTHDYGYEKSLEIQNLLDSHDVARLGSVVMNPTARLDHDSSVKERPEYNIGPPDERGRRKLKLMASLQFLAPGAPYIYYGTEAGMWGADDPDCRKPMLWPDLRYDNESFLFTQKRREPVAVKFDDDLHRFYRSLCRRRHDNSLWRRGSFEVAGSGKRWFAFRRSLEDREAVVIVNAGDKSIALSPGELALRDGEFTLLSSLVDPGKPSALKNKFVVEPWDVVLLE